MPASCNAALLFALFSVAAIVSPFPAHASALASDEVVVTAERSSADSGPRVSASGASDYGVTAQDIANLPTGAAGAMTDVLTRMPGVAFDQNQQIHIRDTEGPQFQYQINGALVPLDINTNPPFLSMINPLFVRQLDLLDGVLPSRYSYATGGVIDIQTKDGCEAPGGRFTALAGHNETLRSSGEVGGCDGKASYYLSGLHGQGETAFSSATPGPNPIHDFTRQGQAFGFFAYDPNAATRLSLVLSAAASVNQLPNVANLPPQFTLAGVGGLQSANINSMLNFQDYLAILSLKGSTGGGLDYQFAYAAHFISQDFRPDDAGELIFQGVASRATHRDIDNTLQGDLAYHLADHTLRAGFYAGDYSVDARDASLVFPVDANGQQTSTTPVQIQSEARATNIVLGLYLDDQWRIGDRLSADLGVRIDGLSGFTRGGQIDPTVNLTWRPTETASVHAGLARYFQIPSYQGISPNAVAAFAGTTAAGPPGAPTPLTEDDTEADVGVIYHATPHLTVSEDSYYEITHHYLDTGQFGVVPIFAPFNYGRGYMWGEELAATYRAGPVSAYANVTIGQNWQKGVATGQFNFDPDELAYIDSHAILLDHQPLASVSAGATYRPGGWLISADVIYSSGLRAGFADQRQLPPVAQVNAAVERAWVIPRLGKLTNRLTILNAFDRVNLIRPAQGIGIFQSAYGPRFTVLDSLTVPF